MADLGPPDALRRFGFVLTQDEHDLLVRKAMAQGGPLRLLVRASAVGQDFALELNLDELLEVADFVATVGDGQNLPVDQLVVDALYDRLHGFLLSLAPEDASESEGPVLLPDRGHRVTAVALPLPQIWRLMTDWEGDRPAVRLNRGLALKDLAGATFLLNARIILQALGEAEGTKATPKGNLNRKFVTEMLDRLHLPPGWADECRRRGKAINEEDLWDLHIPRLVLNLARLIARRRDVMRVTKRGRQLMADERAGELYELLFRTFFRDLNLAYLDWLPVGGEYQHLVGVGLYYLHAFANPWRRVDYLGDLLVPSPLLPELKELPGVIKPHYVAESRLLRPLEDFGLLEMRDAEEEDHTTIREARKTPLFDRFISFDLDLPDPARLTHPEQPGVH